MSVAPPPYWGGSSEAPPLYWEASSEAPPAYSEGEDLSAQLEQMKAMMEKMRLEKDSMIWKMHLQKEEKMEQMRLEKDSIMMKMHLQKEEMMEKMEKMRLEKEALIKQGLSVSSQMRIQMEKKEFIAKEKHWSIDSWEKASSPSIRSIVSTFLKTIPTETVYAIYSTTLREYGNGMGGCPPMQYSQMQLYIATDSKVYVMYMSGDVSCNFNFGYPGCGVFKEIVTFPSEPTPTFWRAIFSQMGHENAVYTTNGKVDIYHLANAKLEALFKSFR